MARTPATSLRQPPTQPRARARIESILDAAAAVFDEVGYEAATISQIVERAGVSPGTLYRWFPDKPALAEALAERYLDAMVDFYRPLLENVPDEPAAQMIRRILRALVAFVSSQQALVALLSAAATPLTPSAAGRRLEANLHDQVRALIELRVPELDVARRDRIAAVLLRVILVMLGTVPSMAVEERGPATEEYIDLILAYIEAKFPAPDHPVWSDPDPTVRPLVSAPQIGPFSS